MQNREGKAALHEFHGELSLTGCLVQIWDSLRGRVPGSSPGTPGPWGLICCTRRVMVTKSVPAPLGFWDFDPTLATTVRGS